MADDADITQERQEREQMLRDKAKGGVPYDPPAGVPGDCDLCGYWSGRLIRGLCAPCRDKYGMK